MFCRLSGLELSIELGVWCFDHSVLTDNHIVTVSLQDLFTAGDCQAIVPSASLCTRQILPLHCFVIVFFLI